MAPPPQVLFYIKIQGGPNIYGFETNATNDTLADVFGDKRFRPDDSDNKRVDAFSNIYDDDIYATAGELASGRKGSRDSNLKFDLENDGVTVEFWLKKGKFLPDLTKKEVIFDLTSQASVDSDSYGRFRLELSGSEDGTTPFILTCRSGAYNDGNSGGFSNVSIAPTSPTMFGTITRCPSRIPEHIHHPARRPV